MTQTTASAALRSMIKADYTKFSPAMFCPAGQVSKADGSACVACAADTIKPMAGFAKCVACAADTYATADFTQCKPLAFCPPGKSLDSAVAANARFLPASCSSCAADDYKALAGAQACATCATSGNVNDAATKCAATAAICAAPLMLEPTDKSQCYIP